MKAPERNVVVLDEYQLCFMLVPKVANTSIKTALCEALGLEGDPHRAFDLKTAQQTSELDFLRIAFVRSPFERAASCWKDKIQSVKHKGFDRFPQLKRGMSFIDFVEEICKIPDDDSEHHFKSQYSQLSFREKFLPDVLLRSETLAKSWCEVQNICRGRGLELPPIQRLNSTQNIQVCWTTRSLDLLCERYEKDLDLYRSVL